MTHASIIDSLYSLPKKGPVVQLSDCVPFQEDLTPRMQQCGLAGIVLAHGNCRQCQYEWECADRMTNEISNLVAQHPDKLRGLAAYDPLRIGESMGWLDKLVRKGQIAGAYMHSEACIRGVDSARMYPLYGMCAMLRVPVVVEFVEEDCWKHQRSQLELVASDFPDLDLAVVPPRKSNKSCIIPMMKRFPRLSFLLGPQDLQESRPLRDYIDSEAGDRVLFRSAGEDWSSAVVMAQSLRLGPAALRAYLGENAERLFGFSPSKAESLSA
jgi:predicted TIM-barrel fold metal-dependent hydrolase